MDQNTVFVDIASGVVKARVIKHFNDGRTVCSELASDALIGK